MRNENKETNQGKKAIGESMGSRIVLALIVVAVIVTAAKVIPLVRNRVQTSQYPVIELEGILMTMYDRRLKLTEQVEEEVKTHFPDKVYKTIIPRNVRLSEAPSFGIPALYFDPHSRGSRAYQELTKEILKKYRNQK